MDLAEYVEGCKKRFQDYIDFASMPGVVSIKIEKLNRPITDVEDLDKLPDGSRFEINHGTLTFKKETLFGAITRWVYRGRVQLTSFELLTLLVQSALDKLDIVYSDEHVVYF
jgi:hypothetical protein|nr:MAG TPA: hypothetical protein [Caudoviricetes sp.]